MHKGRKEIFDALVIFALTLSATFLPGNATTLSFLSLQSLVYKTTSSTYIESETLQSACEMANDAFRVFIFGAPFTSLNPPGWRYWKTCLGSYFFDISTSRCLFFAP